MDSLRQLVAVKKREIADIQKEKEYRKEKYLRRAEKDVLLEKLITKNESITISKEAKTKESKELKELEEKQIEPNDIDTNISISWTEMKKRLRELRQPITIFGETMTDRIKRLRQSQHQHITQQEDQLLDGHDTRNLFLEEHRKYNSKSNSLREDEEDEDESKHYTQQKIKDDQQDDLHQEMDEYTHVYTFFRQMLKSWEHSLAIRPDQVKRTAQGKLATRTMKQCKDYIRPLFKLCKTKTVPKDILPHLVAIVRHCQAKEFVQANDAYIKLAIGNAAWPIGVTMVGIHERTGREKINSNKQAHVMNNEAQRKYLTSVKRLVSYAQSISNVLPSKKVS